MGQHFIPNSMFCSPFSLREIKSRTAQTLLDSAFNQNLYEPDLMWETLQKYGALLHTVVANAPITLYALDARGYFTLAEGNGLQRLGFPAETVVGQSVFDLPYYDPKTLTMLEGVLRGEEANWIGKISEWICENRATPIRHSNNEVAGLVWVAIDVTECLLADAELQIRARQQEAVAQLGQRALANTDLTVLIDEAVKLIATILRAEYCQVWEFLPQDTGSVDHSTQLRLKAGLGWKDGLVGNVIVGAQADTQAHYTLVVGEPVIVEDLRTETRFTGSPLLHDHGVISGISVIIHNSQTVDPVARGSAATSHLQLGTQHLKFFPGEDRRDLTPMPPSKRWGVLGAHTTGKRVFTQDDIHFLQAIANVLAQAIERHRAEERMRLLASAVHHAQDSILITTTNLKSPGPEIVFVNPAFTRMTGYSAADAIGKTPRILQGPKTDPDVLERLRQNLAQGQVFYGETINYRKDGAEFHNEWHIEPIHNDNGEITNYLAIQRDVTERKLAEQRLFYEAFHDSLTGLPNRALFMTRLAEAIELAKHSPQQQFAVLFLDLDRFKVINDSLGHQAGDWLLMAIARRLQDCLRPIDTVARLGGDEFAILLKSVSEIKEAAKLADAMQSELKKPIKLDGNEVFTTASIGIASSQRETFKSYYHPEEMLRDADLAMYRAKANGGARYAIFNYRMHQEAMTRLQLENDLRRAIENQELCLYYQPIITLATGEISGFEALVRWRHPEKGLISPGDFIPIAEETGLIVPLGAWVLQEGCHQLQQWQQEFAAVYPDLTLSINLSGKQFAQVDLIEQLAQILQATGSRNGGINHKLKLEITESTIMENADMAIIMLGHLKALGVQLAIDDFGTGYSSLSRLYSFPIDTLKIDRSFVSSMNTERDKKEIVRTIIMLANNLGLYVTAEGVENQEQLESLRELNCELGQGYYFSKPLDREAATALLTKTPQW